MEPSCYLCINRDNSAILLVLVIKAMTIIIVVAESDCINIPSFNLSVLFADVTKRKRRVKEGGKLFPRMINIS